MCIPQVQFVKTLKHVAVSSQVGMKTALADVVIPLVVLHHN